MQYRTLGTTGITVSRIGFGGAPAGLSNYLATYDAESEDNREQVLAAIARALDLGVTYFDTAPGYGQGISETLFGEGLSGHPEVFLASKVMVQEGSLLRRSVEESLHRLRRDSIDLLQLHGGSYSDAMVDQILRPGGTLDTMRQLQSEGLIGLIGFTSEDQNQPFYRLLQSGGFDVVQVCYNLLFQHPYEPSRPFGSLIEARAAGMGTVSMRATTSGTFQRWIEAVNPDNQFDYTPALIQFALSNPLVDVVLVGMRTPAEVEQNVALCDDLGGRVNLESLHQRYV